MTGNLGIINGLRLWSGEGMPPVLRFLALSASQKLSSAGARPKREPKLRRQLRSYRKRSVRSACRAVAIYSLIESAKLNGLNPQHYLADVLARIADHPARRIAELLPWNWQPLDVTRAAA